VSVSEFHQSQAFVRVLLGVEDVSPVTHRCTTPSTDYPIISRAGRTCGTCKCAFNDSGRYPGCAGFNAFLKGTAQMWRVVLEDGRQIVCTSEHKLLTRDGWRKLAQISLRTGIACAGSVTPTIRGIFLQWFLKCVRRLNQTVRDFQESCFSCFRPNGARLQTAQSTAELLFHHHRCSNRYPFVFASGWSGIRIIGYPCGSPSGHLSSFHSYSPVTHGGSLVPGRCRTAALGCRAEQGCSEPSRHYIRVGGYLNTCAVFHTIHAL